MLEGKNPAKAFLQADVRHVAFLPRQSFADRHKVASLARRFQ